MYVENNYKTNDIYLIFIYIFVISKHKNNSVMAKNEKRVSTTIQLSESEKAKLKDIGYKHLGTSTQTAGLRYLLTNYKG